MSEMGNNSNNETGDLLYCVCGFFIPLVGLILWLVWKDGTPKQQADAKQAGLGGLISIGLAVVFYVLLIIVAAMIAASEPTYLQELLMTV